MTSDQVKLLTHLEKSFPESSRGYTTTLYSIALEGWRRGLNLKFINSKRSKSNTVFELSDGNKTHRFISSRGDLITQEAMKICRNKSEAKKYLLNANVPTPRGRDFSEEISEKEIIEYANYLGYPLVIKPLDGTGGKGVIANLANEQELRDALIYVRYELGYKHIIVEQYFAGEDYRVYVLENEVIAATKRIPANIIGDGKSTIKDLIKKKNELRRKYLNLGSSPIKLDQELQNTLQKQGFTLNSIAPKDKQVFLKSKNNISSGGDPIDVTDKLSRKIKEIAIAGRKAIPGLPHAAIDLIVDENEDKAVIIEINSQASLRLHLFPMKGFARDVPSKLIDYYFPDTIANHNCPLYFDFGPVWEQFRKNLANEIVLPKLPGGKLILTRFVVRGKIRRVGYASWVRKKARDIGVHGYVRHMPDHTVSIVACGNEKSINEFRNIITTKTSKHAKPMTIEEKTRTTPVEVGFKIYNASMDRHLEDGYAPVRLKDPKPPKKRRRKNKKQKKSIDYKKEYEKIINSTSWKITKPIRMLGRLYKKIINKGK